MRVLRTLPLLRRRAAAADGELVPQFTRLIGVCVLALSLGIAAASGAAERVPDPTVSGPVGGGSHGQPFGALSAEDLSQSHYMESEYFFSGTANAYEKDGAWGLDGIWNGKPVKQAAYKVRLGR
jgi:hypothetical protein